MNTSDDISAFHPISSRKSEKTSSDELLSNNPFFPPIISSSNDFHSRLALLRPFFSVPSLSFWQTFPFLRPPDLIPPSPIRPKALTIGSSSLVTRYHQFTITHNNLLVPSLPSSDNFIRRPKNFDKETKKSKNLKKYKCDICLRAFSRSNTLLTHKRIHTGEKPFICNICNRAFRQPGNLTRHKLTHTNMKSYACELCTKSFNRLSNLQAHQRTHASILPTNEHNYHSHNDVELLSKTDDMSENDEHHTDAVEN